MARKEAIEVVRAMGYHSYLALEMVNALMKGYEMAVDKSCEWLKARNVLTDASLEGYKKAMEE